MAIDLRYQATLEKVKLHSSFLAGKWSTAQTSGGSDDGASAPMNICDPDQRAPSPSNRFSPERCQAKSSALVGDTSAAFHTLVGSCAWKAPDITRRAPRLSAACFVQKEEFLAS